MNGTIIEKSDQCHEELFICKMLDFNWSEDCLKNVSLQHFSISSQPELICWEGSCHAVLLRKLEIALKDHQGDEAWETFEDIKRLYGFPSHSLATRPADHRIDAQVGFAELAFQFNDIDGAAGLVLDMCRCWDSLSIQKDRNDPHKTCLVPIESYYLKEGLKLQIVPELLQKDSVFKMDSKQELLLFRNGKYVLSNKALAKLIIAYKRDGGLISDVIDACIQLGWLETAHDILDDMELAGAPASSITYMSLLTAYYKGKMVREAKALLKQMRKAGLIVDLSDEMVMTTCLSGVVDKNRMHTRTSTSIWKSGLAESLVREMKKQEKAILPVGVPKVSQGSLQELESINTRTEAQSKRLEYVEAFRTWAGID
ncbi:Pentatricopeptide repeat-containing protein [Vitis vinifera]|uniref:Pentatricopeptide repeat-containing protein n=1 Tax=Vitis vinifera TaxID=29760 RepID=A0A438C495_VITVI|nr:Pentatricopeptide repeat-containing protein [Vitis vinifera]